MYSGEVADSVPGEYKGRDAVPDIKNRQNGGEDGSHDQASFENFSAEKKMTAAAARSITVQSVLLR